MIKKVLLFIISLLIYLSFGFTSIIFISFSAFSIFYAALLINKKPKNCKRIFVISLICNLLALIIFKVLLFIDFKNIFIPLGISYYTFQVIGYLIDVYRKKYPAEKSLFNFLLFVFYIPYLFIGPINRYDVFKDSNIFKEKNNFNDISNGFIRISWGLFKKYVIAERIAIIVGTISTSPSNYSGAYVFLALILYSFQLYSDFSGGIDIVIGISNIIGIKTIENFDRPYLAQNLKEFWRKWHISLSSWFKDYLYIPLGGNRCSKIRNKLNLLIVFIVSGLWHGINYFFWGLFHGLIIIITPKENSDYKYLNIILNFLTVSFLWIFFIYSSTLTSFEMLLSIFYKFNGIDLFNNILNLGLNLSNLIIMILSIILLIIVDINYEKLKETINNLKFDKKLFIILTILLLVLVFGIYGIGFEKSNFIYGKF